MLHWGEMDGILHHLLKIIGWYLIHIQLASQPWIKDGFRLGFQDVLLIKILSIVKMSDGKLAQLVEILHGLFLICQHQQYPIWYPQEILINWEAQDYYSNSQLIMNWHSLGLWIWQIGWVEHNGQLKWHAMG